MIHDIFLATWFMLPAALANVAPIIAVKIPFISAWDAPIDAGKTFRGQPVLGSHKTWRGIVAGVVISSLIFWLQRTFAGHFASLNPVEVDYPHLSLWLGPLFGLGALGGDALKSFFKRRRNVPSGQHWIPFDQLDYIIGALLISLPFVVLPGVVYGWVLIIWFGAHLLASYVGYRTGFKEAPI